jgi:hypothetical protein
VYLRQKSVAHHLIVRPVSRFLAAQSTREIRGID